MNASQKITYGPKDKYELRSENRTKELALFKIRNSRTQSSTSNLSLLKMVSRRILLPY